MDRCFKGCWRPKFKKKGQQDSFTLAVKVLGNNKIQVPNRCAQDLNGYLKSSQNLLPSAAKLIDGTLVRFDVEQQQSGNTSIVGVDLGFKALATPPLVK